MYAARGQGEFKSPMHFNCVLHAKKKGVGVGGPDSMLNCVHTKSGIFLENIFKYHNDHSDNFGGAILAQLGGFLTISCLLWDIFSAGMAPWCWIHEAISNFRGQIPHPAGL